jgi:hypothetical protein
MMSLACDWHLLIDVGGHLQDLPRADFLFHAVIIPAHLSMRSYM